MKDLKRSGLHLKCLTKHSVYCFVDTAVVWMITHQIMAVLSQVFTIVINHQVVTAQIVYTDIPDLLTGGQQQKVWNQIVMVSILYVIVSTAMKKDLRLLSVTLIWLTFRHVGRGSREEKIPRSQGFGTGTALALV